MAIPLLDLAGQSKQALELRALELALRRAAGNVLKEVLNRS
jgi:hypothetical protein